MAAMALAGCATVLTVGLPQSKYQPLFTTESKVTEYFADVQAADGKVVSDELGTYHHRTFADRVEVVTINELDRDALKTLLSGDVGLLEPLASYRPDGTSFIDWNATERRHRFLTQTLRLRLLPMASTRQYVDQAQKFARQEKARLATSMNAVSAAFSGGTVMYNEFYATSMLKPLGDGFQYVVKDPLFLVYFNELKLGPSGVNEALLQHLRNSTRVEIVPRRYFENLKTAGIVRVFSGCGVLDQRSLLEQARVGFGTPIGNGPLSQRFAQAANGLDALRVRAETACVDGLRALALSGAVQSHTLR